MYYNELAKILFFSISGSFILFCWLNTNFFIEYYKLFKFKGLKAADEYIEENKAGFIEIFPDFLKRKDNFLCNLLTCPICLSVWCSIASIFFTNFSLLIVGYFTFLFYCLIKKCYNALF